MTPKAYPDYVDSGIDWLGSIPSAWKTRPLWSMFERVKDVGHPDEPMLSVFREFGVVFKASRANLNKTAENRDIYQLVGPGWLVTNRMKAWQGSVGISKLRGIVSGHYLCFRPNHVESAAYLNYLFRSAPLAAAYATLSRGVRIGQAEIDNDLYRLLPVLLPPRHEQVRIVEYLDSRTARINLLIEKHERLIETLAERRQAVISRAVTKGLDSNVRLKNSGIEWLGDVPSNWPIVKVGHAYQVTVGKMLNAGKELEGGAVAPYLRAANIQPGGLDLSEVKLMVVNVAEKRALELRRDDVVVVEGGGGFGRSDVLREDLPGWVFQNHVLRVRPRNADSSEFFDYVMKTINANGHVASLSNHATIPSISSEKLASIRLALPEARTQRLIVDHLDRESLQIDALAAKAREMINVLRERRQALISAVVTGKIDVRGLS